MVDELRQFEHNSLEDKELVISLNSVSRLDIWWKAQPNNKSQSKNDDENNHFKVGVNRPSISNELCVH